MPATYTAEWFLSRFNLRMVDYDIDDALNVVDLGQPQGASIKGVPISDGYRRFVAALFRSVGTGSVTKFQIIAATNAAMTGSPTIVVEHAISSAPDAVGDQIWLECDVEQVREVLAAATHVGLRAQLATAGDEAVIFFGRGEPTFVKPALTADYIAA